MSNNEKCYPQFEDIVCFLSMLCGSIMGAILELYSKLLVKLYQRLFQKALYI